VLSSIHRSFNLKLLQVNHNIQFCSEMSDLEDYNDSDAEEDLSIRYDVKLSLVLA
jgi:hypothetical protein